MKQILTNIKTRFFSYSTIFICILAIISAVVNIKLISKLSETTKAIYEHPYTVSTESHAMKSRLQDTSIFISSFLTDAYSGKETTIKFFNTRYDLAENSIKIIEDRYMGPKKDIISLKQNYNLLKSKQLKCIDYADFHSKTEVLTYVESEIYPQYDALNDCLDRIIAFADSNIERFEHIFSNIAQKTIWVSIMLTTIIVIFSIYFRHIERKKTKEITYREKLFDILVTNIDDVFYIFDCKNNKYEYISKNAKRIFSNYNIDLTKSLDPLQEILPLITMEDAKKLKSGIQADFDFALTRNDGEEHFMKLRLYPQKEKNCLVRYIISISDQSKEIETQQLLKNTLTTAQHANSAKSDFLSRMSHEIRTPLNAIIGMTTIAAAYIDDKHRIEDCISKITYSSKHLLSLINDILDMSKIEEGKLTINHETFNIIKLIESLSSVISQQARDKNINFQILTENITEEILIGDELRLNQILLNLLSNSLKFTQSGGDVQLKIQQLKKKNKRIRFRFIVNDTGIGMSSEFMERLFTPFEQSDASISQKYGGTGLGLSITKNLITLQNGDIDVKSKLGEGTTFIVELEFEMTSYTKQSKSELESLHILIADNDSDSCIHTSVLLDKMGISADCAQTGDDAINKTLEAHKTNNDYDVFLIDWQMPILNALETTKQIRNIVGSNALIIIVATYKWDEIEEKAVSAGANTFLAKPIFASSLYNVLISNLHTNSIQTEVSSFIEHHNLSGCHVLLAEDNPLNQEIAVEILKMMDIKATCVSNGEEALNTFLAAQEKIYDLILMDIQMPYMDGYTATKAIRNSNSPFAKTIPILAMTANAFNEDISAALKAGMNGHIAKPIDMDSLYQVMEQCFHPNSY